MADPEKVAELAKELEPVKALEPVALDPTKLAEAALEEAGGDLPTAREIASTKIADTNYKE